MRGEGKGSPPTECPDKKTEKVMLNEKETLVFKAICEGIQQETGGQFGWADDIKEYVEELTVAQIAGYCSILAQKGVYIPMKDGDWTQTALSKSGVALAKELGDERWYEAHG